MRAFRIGEALGFSEKQINRCGFKNPEVALSEAERNTINCYNERIARKINRNWAWPGPDGQWPYLWLSPDFIKDVAKYAGPPGLGTAATWKM